MHILRCCRQRCFCSIPHGRQRPAGDSRRHPGQAARPAPDPAAAVGDHAQRPLSRRPRRRAGPRLRFGCRSDRPGAWPGDERSRAGLRRLPAAHVRRPHRPGRPARAADPGGPAGRWPRQPRAGRSGHQEGRLSHRRTAARTHRRRQPARPAARVRARLAEGRREGLCRGTRPHRQAEARRRRTGRSARAGDRGADGRDGGRQGGRRGEVPSRHVARQERPAHDRLGCRRPDAARQGRGSARALEDLRREVQRRRGDGRADRAQRADPAATDSGFGHLRDPVRYRRHHVVRSAQRRAPTWR